MLTEKEKELVADLKYLNADIELIYTLMEMLKTPKQQDEMIESLVKRYQQKGEVTEQEMLKLAIMITVPKKNQSNPTPPTDKEAAEE